MVLVVLGNGRVSADGYSSFKIAGRYSLARPLFTLIVGTRVAERTFSFQLFRPRSSLPSPDEAIQLPILPNYHTGPTLVHVDVRAL